MPVSCPAVDGALSCSRMRGTMRHAQLFRVSSHRRRSITLAVVVSMLAAMVPTLPGAVGGSGGSGQPQRTGHVEAVAAHFTKPVDQTTQFSPHSTAWPE